ncbi:unnamed protein product [Lactuca saligna]|uniref:Uncharacterized protein n=1 Tax=Lactuca saligna TaxID=75948 RepID=A0AA36E5A5_LACSI|nr:unnamed protein product [Lactuca saligna]
MYSTFQGENFGSNTQFQGESFISPISYEQHPFDGDFSQPTKNHETPFACSDSVPEDNKFASFKGENKETNDDSDTQSVLSEFKEGFPVNVNIRRGLQGTVIWMRINVNIRREGHLALTPFGPRPLSDAFQLILAEVEKAKKGFRGSKKAPKKDTMKEGPSETPKSPSKKRKALAASTTSPK